MGNLVIDDEFKRKTIEEVNKLTWENLDKYEHQLYKGNAGFAFDEWFIDACRDRRNKLRYVR